MRLSQSSAVWTLILTTLVASSSLQAHGPTPQKAEDKIEIAAPPDKVWEIVGDFARFCEWHPAIAKCAAEGGSKSGATRALTLKSGGVISESVDDYNEADKEISYRLAKENIEAFPVSFYSASIRVKPEGSGSVVEWTGRFYRGDTSNFPPENLNDEAAVKAMSTFLRQGLEGLKAKLGAKG